ncbi:Uncharacterised protein [Yersinia pseudotuberculosis]|nr:Uncharacterised protein [Yersinia pseudotuberculosis]CND72997.1 Uncharacterised protein [Yersinia pseudotuberculosis]CQH19773.1 Uncharacterised protein [Yersinia pseudotuberculosis]
MACLRINAPLMMRIGTLWGGKVGRRQANGAITPIGHPPEVGNCMPEHNLALFLPALAS